MNKLFKVFTNLQLEIVETKYIKIDKTHYWTNEGKFSIQESLTRPANFYWHFFTKQEAITYLKTKIELKIKYTILDKKEFWIKHLENFKLLYKT